MEELMARSGITDKSLLGLQVLWLIVALLAGAQLNAELVTKTITGPITGDQITFDLYLPESYGERGERYPVIYNLHGRGGSYQSRAQMRFRQAMVRAIAKGILPPVISVYPDGTKNGWYADSKDRTLRIETHIIREIIPWVDENCRTKASRDFRVIQGMSMGGYGASLLAVKFPELFCICVNYDGAMWNWENMTKQSRQWKPVAPVMFDNDREYYERTSSPWTFASFNRDRIKGQVRFRTIVGSLGEWLQNWQNHLHSLGIEMDYVETNCKHNLECLHEAAGEGSFRLMAEQFAKAAKKE